MPSAIVTGESTRHRHRPEAIAHGTGNAVRTAQDGLGGVHELAHVVKKVVERRTCDVVAVVITVHGRRALVEQFRKGFEIEVVAFEASFHYHRSSIATQAPAVFQRS
jgi:hypothetical protein